MFSSSSWKLISDSLSPRLNRATNVVLCPSFDCQMTLSLSRSSSPPPSTEQMPQHYPLSPFLIKRSQFIEKEESYSIQH